MIDEHVWFSMHLKIACEWSLVKKTVSFFKDEWVAEVDVGYDLLMYACSFGPIFLMRCPAVKWLATNSSVLFCRADSP